MSKNSRTGERGGSRVPHGPDEQVRPKLTRDLLVRTALRIADDEGLEALSMRRLGDELGVDAMAAYRHLPNKKALLEGIVEAVLADADVSVDTSSPWQEQFRAVARAYRDALLSHSPAVARMAATTPLNSPSTFGIVEHAVRVLTGAGIRLEDAILAMQFQGALTAGVVMTETFWREQEMAGGHVILSPPVLPLPEFPVLSAGAAAGAFGDSAHVFEFGLDALVAYLEQLPRVI